MPPGNDFPTNAGSHSARFRKLESGAIKGYEVKICSPYLALNAGSSVRAGENVLDSIPSPAMAIRGNAFDFFSPSAKQQVCIPARKKKKIRESVIFIYFVLTNGLGASILFKHTENWRN